MSENNPKLSQEACVKVTWNNFWVYNSYPVDTPIEKGPALSLDQCSKTDDKNRDSEQMSLTLVS